tara:strand:+ start:579 stop:1460 length:882 start_codon:yes stop_codon:yes gene_type:complete
VRNNSLWDRVLRISDKAIYTKSLLPFKTSLQKLIDEEYIYELRSIIGKPTKQNIFTGPQINPFSPWDINLEVNKINEQHVLILNKYPVELGHLLLITSKWKPQDGWLEKSDWEALNQVEEAISGFWFFNSSSKAGASQPHRHFQLLKRNNPNSLFPRQYWFQSKIGNSLSNNSRIENSCLVVRRNNYKNKNSAEELENLYLDMCFELGLGTRQISNKPKFAYNLIITNNFVSMIRRSKESFKGFNINALGFAGYFLVTRNSNIKWLLEKKPSSILNEVVSPLNYYSVDSKSEA